MHGRHIARQHNTDLVGENFLALVIHDATSIPVAVETERNVRAIDQHCITHSVQNFHIFGVGMVSRERVIEIAVKRNDLAPDRLQNSWRESASGAVAAGGHDLEFAPELWPLGQIGDVALWKILHELVTTAT